MRPGCTFIPAEFQAAQARYPQRAGLTPADLIEIGGEDADHVVRRVEQAWKLIAAAGLAHADLEAHPELTRFAVSTSRKKQKAAAAGDGPRHLWSLG